MKTNRVFLVLIIITLIFSNVIFSQENKKVVEKKPLLNIAILLDTSNSMDGLIHQAKTQLWKIVNELATTKRNGQVPVLKVALYEYGKSTLSPREGYLRMVIGLTSDLDSVSEKLFALKTRGGSEYCGWVIQSALEELGWSKSHDDFKAIFIAGNEPFTQGRVHYTMACKQAVAKGVIINTIHCGPYQTGVYGKWKHAAELADGTYMNIDQDVKEVAIKAPQDKKIMKLNSQLNTTYIPYGRRGFESKTRQLKQDANAKKSSYNSSLQRAVSKSTVHYRNTSWDLVDAVMQGKVKIEDIKKEDLPKNLQKMTLEQRKVFIKKQYEKRKKIKESMQKLNSDRKKYVKKKREKEKAAGNKMLESAIINTLHKQLKSKNFKVGEKK